MSIRTYLALVLSAQMIFSGNVWAQVSRKPNVAVGQVHVTERLAPYMGETKIAVERAFEDNSRVYLVAPSIVDSYRDKRFPGTVENTYERELKNAREVLAKGRKAYQSLEFDESKKHLKEAVGKFISGLPGLRTNREFLDAHLYMGAAEFVTENQAAAEAWFQRAVYLDPDFQPTAKNFPPRVLELYSRIKQDIMTGELARVKFTSAPPEASIFLNGKPLGKTPLERRFPQGKYFVLMEKKGMRTFYGPENFDGRLVSVQKNLLPSQSDMEWADLFRVREKPEEQRAALDFLSDFAAATGANVVFLGSAYKKRDFRFLGQLFDARTQRFSLVAVANLGADPEALPPSAADLVDTLTGFIDENGFVSSPKGRGAKNLGVADQSERPEQIAGIQLTKKSEKSWYQKWWVYPLIGLAVGGAVIGLLQINSGGGSSKLLIDNSENF